MAQPANAPSSPQLAAYADTESLLLLAEQLQSAVGTSDFDLALHLLNGIGRLQHTLSEALLTLAEA